MDNASAQMKPILINVNNAISRNKHDSFDAHTKFDQECGNVVSGVQSVVSSLRGSAISSPFAAFSDSATQTSSRLARTLVSTMPYACGQSSSLEKEAVVDSKYLSIQAKTHSHNSHLKATKSSFMIISDNKHAMRHSIKDNARQFHFIQSISQNIR